MKKIEDIENLSEQELEKLASENSCTPPEGLRARLEELIDSKYMESVRRSKRQRMAWISATAGIAAAAIAALLLPKAFDSGKMKDTFDDPYLAYAEVEKTFSLISKKVHDVSEKAIEAEKTLIRPIEILNTPIAVNNRDN